jgi:Ca-activated chloride channel family protein
MRILLFLTLIFIFVPATAAQQTPVKDAATGAASIAIVVDCSGSQRLQMDKVVSLIKQIAESMRPGDEAFLVRFVDTAKITVRQDFTGDKAEIADAADDLYVEGGATAVIDAVDFAARHFAESASKNTDRVIILISDGDDRGSAVKPDEAVSFLKQEKIRVFTIGISDLTVSAKALDKLAKETGGKAFVPRTPAELSNAVVDISSAIRGEKPAKK